MLESLLVIYRPEFWAGLAWPAALQVRVTRGIVSFQASSAPSFGL